jgi:hypothetical protein
LVIYGEHFAHETQSLLKTQTSMSDVPALSASAGGAEAQLLDAKKERPYDLRSRQNKRQDVMEERHMHGKKQKVKA